VLILIHACLRHSDLQRSKGLKPLGDALPGLCWKSRSNATQFTWAALKVGFSGVDWTGPWMRTMEVLRMPGHDFVVRAVNRNFDGFLEGSLFLFIHFCRPPP